MKVYDYNKKISSTYSLIFVLEVLSLKKTLKYLLHKKKWRL